MIGLESSKSPKGEHMSSDPRTKARASDTADDQRGQIDSSTPARPLWRPESRRHQAFQKWLRCADLVRDTGFAVSITVLAVLSMVLIVNTIRVMLTESDSLSSAVINGVNGVLLAVVVLELARTLQAHFTTGSRLRPLVVVAIIAAVRELLGAGVRLTLDPNLGATI